MRGSTTIRALPWLLALFGIAPSVAASAPPPPRERVAMPWLDSRGVVLEVQSAHVVIACGTFEFFGIAAECHIRARYRVRTLAATELTLRDGIGLDRVTVDGAVETALAPGVHTVEVDVRRTFGVTLDVEESPYVLSAMAVRHAFAGEHRSLGHPSTELAVPLLGAAGIEGPLTVDATHSGRVEVLLGGESIGGRVSVQPAGGSLASLALRLTYDRTHADVWANGGPTLSLRASGPIDGFARLGVEAGYEVACADHLFLSLAVGVDDVSRWQAVVLEIAAPSLMFIFPSLAVGVGGVLREAREGPIDGGLRLRAAGTLPIFIGLVVDFDVWPRTGVVDLSVGARISL